MTTRVATAIVSGVKEREHDNGRAVTRTYPQWVKLGAATYQTTLRLTEMTELGASIRAHERQRTKTGALKW